MIYFFEFLHGIVFAMVCRFYFYNISKNSKRSSILELLLTLEQNYFNFELPKFLVTSYMDSNFIRFAISSIRFWLEKKFVMKKIYVYKNITKNINLS